MKSQLIQYKIDHPSDIVIKDPIIKDFLSNLYPNIENTQQNLKMKASLYLNDLNDVPKCHCGNKLEFIGPAKSEIYATLYGGWRQYCSRKCMYASPKTKSKRRTTTLERYGVEHFSKIQKFESKWSDDKKKVYNEKNRVTSLERYGVDHHSKTSEYLVKRETTCVERYGVTNTYLLPKVKETMIERYGYDTWLKSEAANISRRTRVITPEEKLRSYITFITKKLSDKEFCDILVTKNTEKFQTYIKEIVDRNGYYCRPQIAGHIGLSTSHTNKLFKRFGMQENYLITKGRSFAESEITNFLKSLNVDYIIADRSILKGKEIDVYMPDHKIGIEFDGIYYHSESMGCHPTYHLEKTLGCESNGIQLLHIFENEWADPIKREIWKSIVRNKLGMIDNKIAARKCIFTKVTPSDARRFLDKNHLNGFKAAENHYGLIHDEELVSVMSIGKSYYNKGQNEIVRFASIINLNVQGGLSKMLSNINTVNLITYADRRFSSPLNSSYSKYFSKMTVTTPNWYGICKGMDLKHRLSFTKEKVKTMIGETFDENKTTYENMLAYGIDRIWDCGNLKFSN